MDVLGSRKAGLDWFGLDGFLLLVAIASFVPVGFWFTPLRREVASCVGGKSDGGEDDSWVQRSVCVCGLEVGWMYRFWTSGLG